MAVIRNVKVSVAKAKNTLPKLIKAVADGESVTTYRHGTAVVDLCGRPGLIPSRVAIADLQLRVLPYSAERAFGVFDLPTHHPDPFDRQIIAQALVENVPVVTPDAAFSLYNGLKVVW